MGKVIQTGHERDRLADKHKKTDRIKSGPFLFAILTTAN